MGGVAKSKLVNSSMKQIQVVDKSQCAKNVPTASLGEANVTRVLRRLRGIIPLSPLQRSPTLSRK